MYGRGGRVGERQMANEETKAMCEVIIMMWNKVLCN